jgi:hypothetical protein
MHCGRPDARSGIMSSSQLSAPANAVTVRYAVPDGPEGKPIDARLGVYAQSRRIGDYGTAIK